MKCSSNYDSWLHAGSHGFRFKVRRALIPSSMSCDSWVTLGVATSHSTVYPKGPMGWSPSLAWSKRDILFFCFKYAMLKAPGLLSAKGHLTNIIPNMCFKMILRNSHIEGIGWKRPILLWNSHYLTGSTVRINIQELFSIHFQSNGMGNQF